MSEAIKAETDFTKLAVQVKWNFDGATSTIVRRRRRPC